ncbi:CRIB domain-containing protein RIC4-like [Juglans microcarpa x Juglans regia]|uniref:CRIB domain-containing protein RIC4-like n=1 Tax=Juglans microcarpa x Juglans regia TaxID=2249226 RepID=UPI001B7EE08F|nr:CRIB domain-containing protein RIC4-like [Juglans microcarpa x Juglans regia]
MRDRAERFAVLPFSVGCTSESSVALGASAKQKKPKPESNRPPLMRREEGEDQERPSRSKMKNSFGFLALPKPNIAGGIQRVFRSIKSFSQFFVYKEENEEMEKEMEIGYPTDVKHVTHIGLDGSTTTNPAKGWENLTAPEIISFPSISLRQFEFAMAAQADHEPDDLVLNHVVAPN